MFPKTDPDFFLCCKSVSIPVLRVKTFSLWMFKNSLGQDGWPRSTNVIDINCPFAAETLSFFLSTGGRACLFPQHCSGVYPCSCNILIVSAWGIYKIKWQTQSNIALIFLTLIRYKGRLWLWFFCYGKVKHNALADPQLTVSRFKYGMGWWINSIVSIMTMDLCNQIDSRGHKNQWTKTRTVISQQILFLQRTKVKSL